MLRAAQAEQPDRFTIVDVDGSDAAAGTLGRVLAGGEPQAALRGTVARVPRLAEAGPGGRDRRIAADGGTVLITGATGALGSAVARHLAAHHGVGDLLLLSRRGGEGPGATALAADLAALGARAEFAACDVTDPEALAAVIGAVPDDRPLRAVVHAAGGIDDGVLTTQTAESIDRVLRPKADAALHLHRLTAHLDLDAFVLFSSAAGVLGSPGQSNYAAANTLLDGLARYRRSLGLPGQSLAWGLWEELGDAGRHLDEGDVSRLRRLGMARVLTREEALDLFDAALASGEPYLVPLPVDLAGLRSRAARTGRVPHLFRGLVRQPRRRASAGSAAATGLPALLAAGGEQERVGLLTELVCARTADVLGRPEGDRIDPEQDFLELGMDSLTAVELRNELREATGLRLAASVVLAHSSPSKLARHLAEALPEPGAAAGPAPDPVEEDPLKGVVPLFRQACRQGRVADGIALVQSASRMRPVFTGPEDFGPLPKPVTMARGPVGPRLVCLPSLVMVSGAQEYARFAGALQGRRDVTVLPQPGFTPGDPLPETLGAAVELQALAVRAAVGDDEPYVLVSRSSGGWMTHGVATRLEAEGRAPVGMVLMDTPMPDEPTALPIIQAGVLERETRFGLMDDTRVTAMGRYIELCRDWAPAPTKVPTLAVRPSEQMRDGAGTPIGGGDWRFEWPLPHDSLDAGGDHITMLEEHGADTARAVDAWIADRGL
ncbi:type I polyketide synthase [Nocardiopsis sp. ARC36]